MKLIMKKLLIMMMMSTNLSLPRSRMGSCSLKLRASGWTSSRGRPFTCIQQEYCLEKGWTLHCIVACTENFIPRIVFVFQTHLDQSLSALAISHSSGRLLAPKDLNHIHIYRPATGVLSNIDHQKKNPNIDQISTTQHFIDQISTAKVP